MPQPAAASASPGDDVVVTGSRFGGRTRTQSATPIDAVSREALERNGRRHRRQAGAFPFQHPM